MVKGYCVKCRTQREIKDAKKVTLKNGKPALKGKCPVCGTADLTYGREICQACAAVQLINARRAGLT